MEYGYIRVSTKEQNEQRQLIAMREFGIAENRVYMDKQSGKDFERKNYKRLIRKSKKGRHPRGQEHRPAGADADMFAFCKKLFVLTLSLHARLLYNLDKFNKPFALRNMHVGDLRKNNCVFCAIPMINPERHSGGSTFENV